MRAERSQRSAAGPKSSDIISEAGWQRGEAPQSMQQSGARTVDVNIRNSTGQTSEGGRSAHAYMGALGNVSFLASPRGTFCGDSTQSVAKLGPVRTNLARGACIARCVKEQSCRAVQVGCRGECQLLRSCGKALTRTCSSFFVVLPKRFSRGVTHLFHVNYQRLGSGAEIRAGLLEQAVVTSTGQSHLSLTDHSKAQASHDLRDGSGPSFSLMLREVGGRKSSSSIHASARAAHVVRSKKIVYTYETFECGSQLTVPCSSGIFKKIRSWPASPIEGNPKLVVPRILKANCATSVKSDTSIRRRRTAKHIEECDKNLFLHGCRKDTCNKEWHPNPEIYDDKTINDECHLYELKSWETHCEHFYKVHTARKMARGSSCHYYQAAEYECYPPEPCRFTMWGEWSGCSTTCGYGTRVRHRQLMRPRSSFAGQPQGEDCATSDGKYILEQTQDYCAPFLTCPSYDCRWSEWTSYSPCSASCGGGYKTRMRVVQLEAVRGGRACMGPTEQWTACKWDIPCYSPCKWSPWSHYGPCSASCEVGVTKRMRRMLQNGTGGAPPCDPAKAEQETECRKELCPPATTTTTTTTRKKSILPKLPGGLR